MSSLVPLVEIREDRQKLPKENERFTMHEVLINREFVVVVKPNRNLRQKLMNFDMWPSGLDKRVEFVKIFMLSGASNASHTMNVVGDLESILEKLGG